MSCILYINGEMSQPNKLLENVTGLQYRVYEKGHSNLPYFGSIIITLNDKANLVEQIENALHFFKHNQDFIESLLNHPGVDYAELNFIVKDNEEIPEQYYSELQELVLSRNIAISTSERAAFGFL